MAEGKPSGVKKVLDATREVHSSSSAPMQCANQAELDQHGFSYTSPPYATGYYSRFFHALKDKENLILKTIDLAKLKPCAKKQTLEESCKILEYLGKQKNVPNVVHVYGMFQFGDSLFVFMRKYSERSVHYKMRAVPRLKQDLVQQWARQLGSVLKYLSEKAIAHRSLRVEHLLLDDQECVHLTGWTRATFVNEPVSGKQNELPREFRCRKRNHLPPECFGAMHSAEQIDPWSFGVLLVTLSCSRHPFKPQLQDKSNYEQQWKEFLLKYSSELNGEVTDALSRLFVVRQSDRTTLEQLLKLNYLGEGKEESPSLDPSRTKPISNDTRIVTRTSRPQSKKSRKLPKFEAIPLTTSKVRSRSAKSRRLTTGNSSPKPSSIKKPTPETVVSPSNKSADKPENKKAFQTIKASIKHKTTGGGQQSDDDKAAKIPADTKLDQERAAANKPAAAEAGPTVNGPREEKGGNDASAKKAPEEQRK